MTRKEFEALLEEAFMAGYEDAESDLINESNNVKKEIDKHRDTSSAGEERSIDGFSKYDPNKIKTQNKKWLSNADPHHTNMTMDGSNDFYFVHRNKGANGKSSTPRGRIKVGDDDLLKERQNEKPKGSALKDHIKELKWLREEVFQEKLEEFQKEGIRKVIDAMKKEGSNKKAQNVVGKAFISSNSPTFNTKYKLDDPNTLPGINKVSKKHINNAIKYGTFHPYESYKAFKAFKKLKQDGILSDDFDKYTK